MYIYNKVIIKFFLKYFLFSYSFFLILSFLGSFLDEDLNFLKALLLSLFDLADIVDIVFLFSSLMFFIFIKNIFNYEIIRFYGKKQRTIFKYIYLFILTYSFLNMFLLKPIFTAKINKKISDKAPSQVQENSYTEEEEKFKKFIYVNKNNFLSIILKDKDTKEIIFSDKFSFKNGSWNIQNPYAIDMDKKSVFFLKEKQIFTEIKEERAVKSKKNKNTIYDDIQNILIDFKSLYKKRDYIISNMNLIRDINQIILSIVNFNLILIIFGKFSRLKNLLFDFSKVIMIFFINRNIVKFLQNIYIKYNGGLFISLIFALFLLFFSFYKIEKREFGE